MARIEELRLAAIEDRIRAELGLGRHVELVPELQELVSTHPLRESLRASLMLALYRSGRQADALAVYQEGRSVLAEELGIDPMPELQALYESILRQDPAIRAGPRPSSEGIAPAVGDDVASTGAAEPAHPRTERKVATALFADLVGPTTLTEREDPEVVRSLIGRMFDRLVGEIERYGGITERFVGDAVLAVFGVPAAHEDDPERAIRAALGMLSSVAELNRELAAERGVELSPRIGIADRPRRGAGLAGAAFRRVAFEGRPALVTIFGPAGVGKSRLAAELERSLGDRAR